MPLASLKNWLSASALHSLRLLWLLTRRELTVKYRGSFFGYLWSMLNPLLFMITISFVFSNFFKGIENYNLYVLSGILFWNMTVHSVISGTRSLTSNANLLTKIRTPAWIFVVVPISSAAANLVLACFPYFALAFWSGFPLNENLIFLPLIIVFYSCFLAGICLTLAVLNLYFRDVSHVIDPILQIVFYATPIIYSTEHAAIPSKIAYLLNFNPLTGYLNLFRSALFRPTGTSLTELLALILFATVVLWFGAFVYNRCKNDIVFKI